MGGLELVVTSERSGQHLMWNSSHEPKATPVRINLLRIFSAM